MENFYDKAVEFGILNILPYAKESDEEMKFPEISFQKMHEAGFLKLLVPKEFGGLGANIKDHGSVVRAFSQSSATAGLCYMMHNVALMCIINYADDKLKEKICKEIVEEGKFLALAYSEFGSGTHFYKPEINVKFSENKATFNGKKSMVTSANHASYYAVLAPNNTDGIDNWLFPKDSGIKFETNNWNGLGMRGNISCPMQIDNITLDNFYRIGKSGSGLEQVFNVVAPYFILGLAQVYSGVCQNVLSNSIEWSKSRKYPDGSSLCEIPTIQLHLAEIYTKTASSISLSEEAADCALNQNKDALAKILSARINASANAIDVSTIAMRIAGGKGYNKVGDFERLLRDSFASAIMAPSVDVLNIWLGKAITDQVIP